MNELLSEDDIVACFMSKDEAGLEGMHEIVQVRFNSLKQDLSDRLVDGVAKTDRAKLVNGFGFANFWDEAD